MNKINNRNHTSTISIIIFMFLFCPVGIYLLYKKITEDSTDTLKNSRTVKKLGWFYIFLGLCYLIMFSSGIKTENGESVDVPLTMIVSLFLGVGIFTLLGSRRMKKRGKLYEKCLRIVNSNQTDIGSIASNLSISNKEAENVLQKMLESGFFENGTYIDMANSEIVFPSRTIKYNNVYTQTNVQNSSPVVNSPKRKVVECPNCGADNETTTDNCVTECEYCGSRINV